MDQARPTIAPQASLDHPKAEQLVLSFIAKARIFLQENQQAFAAEQRPRESYGDPVCTGLANLDIDISRYVQRIIDASRQEDISRLATEDSEGPFTDCPKRKHLFDMALEYLAIGIPSHMTESEFAELKDRAKWVKAYEYKLQIAADRLDSR